MAYEKGSRPEGGFKRRGPARRRKKVCVFCGKENNEIDYKDVAKLKEVCFRERKNPSEKNHRKLCKASESSYSSNQESKTHCADAVRSGLIENNRRLSPECDGLFFSYKLKTLLTYVHNVVYL